jgi:hypothetical protein
MAQAKSKTINITCSYQYFDTINLIFSHVQILPITRISSSKFASANMVSTPPVDVFTVDQHIAALEQEILTF